MRIAVVGLGTAGAVAACLLHDAGHTVEVLERAEDPRPVGAGIWLQATGQQVLDRLGLLEPLRASSREVSRIDIRAGERTLVDFTYASVPGATPALGVHRGTLFSLLHDAVAARGVPVSLGVTVSGVRPTPSGVAVSTTGGDQGGYDLVVGADGARSALRGSLEVTARDRPYAYGALWSIVDDPDGLAGDALFQSLRGTRRYLGVLPTGLGRASIFWSVPVGRAVPALGAWRAEALALAGHCAPLVEAVDHLLPASYRDVVVRTPYRCGPDGAAVLVGDAAHAMSPQLGSGTSLALADAWSLAWALAAHPGRAALPTALAAYAGVRAAHVRWYQWWSRVLVPVFQSSLTPLAVPRDALAPLVARVPGVTPQMVRTLCGDRTSPWSGWTLPRLPQVTAPSRPEPPSRAGAARA